MDLIALYLILYLLAAVCFLFYAVGTHRAPSRVSLLGLGVFFWSLVPLIQTLQKV